MCGSHNIILKHRNKLFFSVNAVKEINELPEILKKRKEMFYLTTHPTYFIYSYMASAMVKDHSDSKRQEETCSCHYMSYSFRLEAWGLLHATSHRQDSTYQREREMFYLTTHSTHFIYGYMASDIWLRTILIERKPAAAT